MRRRHYWNGLAGDIQAELHAVYVDIRKMSLDEIGPPVRDIQADAIQALFFHLEIDRPCDDIARRQLCPGIVLGHESGAVGGLGQTPLASGRLRREERSSE